MSAALARPRWSGSALILLRLSIAAVVLLPLAVTQGEALVQSWLSAYGAVFEWVADDFQLLKLFIDHEGADRVVRVVVMWKHIAFVGNQVIYPDPRGTANTSTLLAHGLQGPLVAILAAITWPTCRNTVGRAYVNSRLIERASRVALMLPLLIVLVLIDMPLVLAGELWGMVIDALEPDRISLLVMLKTFLQGGGRYALGVATAMLSVHAARWIAARVIRKMGKTTSHSDVGRCAATATDASPTAPDSLSS